MLDLDVNEPSQLVRKLSQELFKNALETKSAEDFVIDWNC